MTYDPVEQTRQAMRAAQERDQLNRVTSSGPFGASRSVVTFGAIGAVLGSVFGLLVKVKRGKGGRGGA